MPSYSQYDSDAPSEASELKEKGRLVLEWLRVCLEEGHIEPSQPTVGRLCSWPLREFFFNSLYIDFKCWCIKKGLLVPDIPSSIVFYSYTDHLFTRMNDKYFFPDLTECHQKFSNDFGIKLTF